MSLEGHLEKRLFCHCWLKVGKPGIMLEGLLLPMFAKVCKIFNTSILTSPLSIDPRHRVFVVSVFYLKHIFAGTL